MTDCNFPRRRGGSHEMDSGIEGWYVRNHANRNAKIISKILYDKNMSLFQIHSYTTRIARRLVAGQSWTSEHRRQVAIVLHKNFINVWPGKPDRAFKD